MKWFSSAAGVRERVPVLIADVAVWKRWKGDGENASSFDSLEGVVGPTEVGGRVLVPFELDGGVFDVGVGKDEVVVLQHHDGEESTFADWRRALGKPAGKREHEEFLAGELTVSAGVVIGDSWSNGKQLDAEKLGKAACPIEPLVFFAPLASGTYLVLEGCSDDEDVRWYRLRKGKAASYERRPPSREESPEESRASEVRDIMQRARFGDERQEARALEDALRLVELGRPDLALALCDQASPARRVLAGWTRLFALAALERPIVEPLTKLVEEWLSPPASSESANQVLTQQNILDLLDAATRAQHDVGALRQRVASAPSPDVFVSGDADFF